MITAQTVVVAQTQPDLSLEAFTAILESASSPALVEAPQCYQAVRSAGVSIAFATAIFWKESNFGTNGFATANKNPGNTRSSITGIGFEVTTTKGKFIRYPSWFEGFRDIAWRLVAPKYVYALGGLTTIEQIITKWAPPEENDTEDYIATVVRVMNKWIPQGSSNGGNTMLDPTDKVDIVHPNKGRDGGTPQLLVMHVQEGTNYLPDFFRSSGDDSTMWCKQDGTLIRMEQDTDSAWTNGMMTEPIDHTNPVIQSLYSQGVRNTNNWSLTIEHQGFASGQFTDAAIETTAQMCAYWMQKYGWTDVNNRIVGHFQVGEHKNCPGPNFPWAKLRARVKELLGGAVVTQPNLPYGVTVDSAGALIFPVNGVNIPLNFGFKDAFLTLFGNMIIGDLGAAIIRGVRMYGLPLAPEIANDTGSTQDFELCSFRFNKNEAPGWQVRLYKKPLAAPAA